MAKKYDSHDIDLTTVQAPSNELKLETGTHIEYFRDCNVQGHLES